MARKVRAGVRIMADFSSVAKFVGAGEAMVGSVKDQSYMDAVVKTAHGEVQNEFNTEAAAAAAAGANIKHMFEWGTAGINQGRTNMRPSPLSERARLWREVMVGHGLNQTLTYVFKPSIAYVPNPTVRDTGMDVETIQSLERHIFYAKAEVMETGSPVTIKPVNANLLLIPYYPSQVGNIMFSDSDIERGYTLSKGPHTHSPGDTAGTTGQFSAFWVQFWEGRGAKLMDEAVTRQIESDFYPALAVNYSPHTPTLPVPGTFKKQVAEQKKRVNAEARMKARARKKTK